LLDMSGIKRKPPVSDVPHGYSLMDRRWFQSRNTAGPRPGSKPAACLTFSDENQRSPIARKERPMLRTILMTAALLCASQTAFAQEMTAEQRNACMGDYEKFCKGVAPGGGRIIACLAKESDKITPACKKVLTAAEKK
jgi:hypothetical protein